MADLTKAQINANLTELQNKIGSGGAARTAFLKNPAAAITKTGVSLPADRAKAINAFVEKQLAIPGAKVGGASIRPGLANSVEVEVSVKVKF